MRTSSASIGSKYPSVSIRGVRLPRVGWLGASDSFVVNCVVDCVVAGCVDCVDDGAVAGSATTTIVHNPIAPNARASCFMHEAYQIGWRCRLPHLPLPVFRERVGMRSSVRDVMH